MTTALWADYLPTIGPAPLRFRTPAKVSAGLPSLPAPLAATVEPAEIKAPDNPPPEAQPNLVETNEAPAGSEFLVPEEMQPRSSSASYSQGPAETNYVAVSPAPQPVELTFGTSTNQPALTSEMLVQFFTDPPLSTNQRRASVVFPLEFVPPQPKAPARSQAALAEP